MNLEPQTTIHKWLVQLDDSKSLYRKWLEITISIHEKTVCLGFQEVNKLLLVPPILFAGTANFSDSKTQKNKT